MPPLASPAAPASSLNTAYLGRPGSMVRLVVPDTGIAAPMTRGETNHDLIAGGGTVTRRRHTRRLFAMNWSHRAVDEADAILSFYFGTRGFGPFALVVPTWRNLLDMDVSTMGVALSSLTGWSTAASASVPVFSASAGPTVAGVPIATGVGRWPSPVNNARIFAGALSSAGVYTPGTTGRPYATPYLPDQPAIVSMYAATLSSTCSAAVAAIGVPAAGTASPVVATGTTVTLTTTWQRLSVVVPVGTSGWTAAATPYICPALQCLSASAPNILIAAASVQMGTLLTTDPWVTGLGTPRVVILGPAGNDSTLWVRQSSQLQMREI